MANAFQLGGGGGSQSSGSAASGTRVLPELMGVYNQLLGLNQSRYQNVLGAYQNAQASLTSQLPGLYQGYDQLAQQNRDILGLSGGGWGVAQPAATEIGRTFAGRLGAADQQMISSGLGNSTVRASLGNQIAREQANAYGALGAQLANQAAGYQTQIGLARQNAYQGGLQMQNQLSAGMGNALAGMTFANTAGGLTGGYSTSNQSSMSQSPAPNASGGYGGGGGGGGGGGRVSPRQSAGTGYMGTPSGSMGYSGGYAYGGGSYNPYQGGGVGTSGQQVPINDDWSAGFEDNWGHGWGFEPSQDVDFAVWDESAAWG